MREILFKAKRKDNGKWIEGYYQKRYDLLGKRIKGTLCGLKEGRIYD